MKTDPRTEIISAVGELTYTLPALFQGWRVTAIEGGTVTRGGAALAVGNVLAAADVLTLTPVAEGGTTTLTVRLDNQEFSGEYEDLDGRPNVAALEDRVEVLEQGGGGGGGATVLGHGSRAGVVFNRYEMVDGLLPQNRELRVEIKWRGAAQLVGGFRVAGSTLVPADISLFAVVTGGEVETIFSTPETLVATPYAVRNRWGETVESGTEFTLDISEEYQRAAEYGRMIVIFKPSAVPKLRAMAYDEEMYPYYMLPGTTYTLTYQDDGAAINLLVPVQTTARGVAPLGVLAPYNMPLVAAPTPISDQYEDLDRQGGMEIVWPEGGTPYLRVFRTKHFNDPGAEFYLTLSPGRPQ